MKALREPRSLNPLVRGSGEERHDWAGIALARAVSIP